MMFKLADRLYEIVAPCCTKVDGESVTVDEVRHVVPLVDIPAIAHNLFTLFGVKASAVTDCQ
jgi:hypothetical protein